MLKYEIIRIILLIIGIILFAWFFLPVLVTRNFNIGAVTGTAVGVLLIIYAFWFHKINSFIASGWRTTGGRIAEILLLIVCAAIISLAAATSAAMIKAASTSAPPGSTCIVLGARVYQDRPSTAMKSRLDAAYDYLISNPDSACIVSGGQGKNEPCTESSVMYSYLVQKGIDPDRIYQEDRSTDTQENLIFSKAVIEENDLNPTVVLATDGYHEYRALKYAERAGLEAGSVPAHTVWWLFPTGAVREMYGILEMWFLKDN